MSSSSATPSSASPTCSRIPSKVDRTTVGYNYKGLFKNGVAQIPEPRRGWRRSGQHQHPGRLRSRRPEQGLYANKYMPSASDTISKVWGTHTLKAGVFWERIRNAQPANNTTQGPVRVSTSATPTRSATPMPIMLHRQPELVHRDVFQPHQRHLLQHLRRLRAGFLEGEPPADSGTRYSHHALPAVGGQPGLRLLRSSITRSTAPSCTPHAILRLPVEQARSVRAAGRLPHARRVLPAALRRGVRARREARPSCAAAGAATTTTPASSPPA